MLRLSDPTWPLIRPASGLRVNDDATHHMERVTGIEPALSAWEAEVLPLNYTRQSTGLVPGGW